MATMPERSLQLKLFRRQAIDAMSARGLGRVRVVLPPTASAALACALSASALLAAALLLIEVPDRVPASGMLLPAGRLLPVTAPRGGIVTRMLVVEGELVGRGQRLIEIGGQRLPAELRSPPEERLDSLAAELELLEARRRSAERTAAADARALREQVGHIDARIRVTGQERRVRQAEIESRRRQAARIAALAKRHAVSGQAADEQAALALAAEAALHAVEQRGLALAAERRSLEHRIARHDAAVETEQLDHEMRREALRRDMVAARMQVAVAVTAPDGGKVAGLSLREGSPVAAGQLLHYVVAPDAVLEAYLYISADRVADIEAGQSIELELAGHPRQLHGTLPAVIETISQAPTPAPAIVAASLPRGAVFEVRAKLAPASSKMGLPRTAGATFRADLVRRRVPLYRWIMQTVSGRA